MADDQDAVDIESITPDDDGSCPRCGNFHIGLAYTPLANPRDEFRYWASCPTTGQPVLIAFGPKGDVAGREWKKAMEEKMEKGRQKGITGSGD